MDKLGVGDESHEHSGDSLRKLVLGWHGSLQEIRNIVLNQGED